MGSLRNTLKVKTGVFTSGLARFKRDVFTLRDVRSASTRARMLFGLGSGLVVVGFLLSQSIVQVALDALTASMGTGGELLWLGVLVVLGVALFARWNSALSSSARPETGEPTSTLSERKGLVVLCGLESDKSSSSTAQLLKEAKSLEFLVLVGTPQTRARGVGDRIVSVLLPSSGHHLDRKHVRVMTDAAADSVSGFEQAVHEAISWLERCGLDSSQILVDVSEGRRAMGFGALVASQNHHVECQFQANEYDPTGLHRLGSKQFKTVQRQD